MLNCLAVATGNSDKVREIELCLSNIVETVYWVEDYPGFKLPPETGSTLQENAYLKAAALYSVAKIPAIADDTGLFVDALEGRPGVYSGRYAGEQASYRENLAKLLREMEAVPAEQRQAEFRTEICCIWPGGHSFLQGSCAGRILTQPEAAEGAFGYDPVFLPDEGDLPFSRMSLADKNRISHRGRALSALADWLRGVELEETEHE